MLAREIATNDHFQSDGFASMPHGHVGVRTGHVPCGHDVFDRIQKCFNAVRTWPLEDASWHDHVERADAVDTTATMRSSPMVYVSRTFPW